MGQPGIGAMLGYLGGNAETVAAYHKAMGKKIVSVRIDTETREDGACVIAFDDGASLTIWDGARSCCESRYITCDDDLSTFAGATLVSAEVRAGGETEGEYGEVSETQFVDVKTTNGDFTLCTHNDHNGYYGGFHIQLAYAEAA